MTDEKKPMTVDDAIGAYLKLRNKKDSMEAALKQQTDVISGVMKKLEHFLLTAAAEQGVDSFKTEHGTAFIKETDFASVEDWDALLEYVMNTKSFEFLTKKVNKTPVKEFIDANGGELPPGTSYGVQRGIQIRVPANNKK